MLLAVIFLCHHFCTFEVVYLSSPVVRKNIMVGRFSVFTNASIHLFFFVFFFYSTVSFLYHFSSSVVTTFSLFLSLLTPLYTFLRPFFLFTLSYSTACLIFTLFFTFLLTFSTSHFLCLFFSTFPYSYLIFSVCLSLSIYLFPHLSVTFSLLLSHLFCLSLQSLFLFRFLSPPIYLSIYHPVFPCPNLSFIHSLFAPSLSYIHSLLHISSFFPVRPFFSPPSLSLLSRALFPSLTLPFSLSLIHFVSLSLSLSLVFPYSLCLSLVFPYSLCLSLSFPSSLCRSPLPILTLSLSFLPSHTFLSLSLSLFLIHSDSPVFSLSLNLSFSHTVSCCLSLLLTRQLSLSLSLSLSPINVCLPTLFLYSTRYDEFTFFLICPHSILLSNDYYFSLSLSLSLFLSNSPCLPLTLKLTT
ncbi:unnamed protein product [Acanthosepion pharaonis]|uniref:Uncharacterized protein n=1 Tax=Acanthosepion pharaonis TaxID=158019 RepID=A0A812DB65_ACAPH|nr:unnamed protein product [Sepia pharaonis]